MAPRHGRSDKQLKAKYEKKTDNVLGITAIVALVMCGAINASVFILAPTSDRVPFDSTVFIGLLAVLVPDFIKFIRGGKS